MHRILAFAAAVLLLTAGCVSRQDSGASETDPPAETTTTTESEPETTTTTSETTAAPAPENAADGTNYAACADGTCEVFVTGDVAIPLAPEFGFTAFRVVQSADSITLVDGGPIAAFGPGGQFGSGDLTIELRSTDATGAIVVFSVG